MALFAIAKIGAIILPLFSGYGAEAVRMLMRRHAPLPAVQSVRRCEWIANIAPGNERSEEFFRKLAADTEATPQPESYISAGDDVVAIGRLKGKAKHTGKPICSK